MQTEFLPAKARVESWHRGLGSSVGRTMALPAPRPVIRGGRIPPDPRPSTSSPASRRPPPRAAAREGTTTTPPKSVETGTLFCFGCGYTGLAVSEALRDRGWRTHGTCRTPERADALDRLGIVPHVFSPADGTDLGEDARDALASSTAILSTIPPSANPSSSSTDPVASLLGRLGPSIAPDWLGYVSTTGVYGDHGGDWVTETAALRTCTARGMARIEAEAEWARLGRPVHVFRSGGIYGPSRNVLETKSVPANAARRQRERYTNRIHIYDLVQVILKSVSDPKPGVYNAVDDCPAPREDVIRFVSERSPIAASAFAKAAGLGSGKVAPLSPASKRVRNDKMKRDLGAVLEYPTYAEGMAAIMDGDLRPFTPASIKHLL